MGNITVINMTPHSIVVKKNDGTKITFPPCGNVLRIHTEPTYDGSIMSIPVNVMDHVGYSPELPEPKDGVYYLTSTFAAMVLRRSDVLAPDSGKSAFRDSGKIYAVSSLQRFE